MSDDIPNSDTRSNFSSFLLVNVSYCVLSAILTWYLWHGREGATDIWKVATAIFVIWLIWDRWNTNRKSEMAPSMSIMMSKDSMIKILDIERAVIGKQRTYWHNEKTGIWISYTVTLFFFVFFLNLFDENQYLAIKQGSSDLESWIYGFVSSSTTSFLYWTLALIILKIPRWDILFFEPKRYFAPDTRGDLEHFFILALRSNWGFLSGFFIGLIFAGIFHALVLGMIIQAIVKLPLTTTLGAFSALIIEKVLGWLSYFALVEVSWDVILANRVLVLVGQLMTESMTQDYFPSQNWRIWILIYLVWVIVGGVYGTLAEKPKKFILPFGIFSLVLAGIASNQTFINYDSNGTLWRLMFATILAIVSFILANRYSISREEYHANRLRSYFMAASVIIFLSIFVIMDPPDSIQKLACDDIIYEYNQVPLLDSEGNPTAVLVNGSEIIDWECALAHFQGPRGNDPIPVIGKLAEGFSEPGLKPSQWGGLFVNLIVAAAGCVLGFVVGIGLAFGRQSNLPFFKVPSVLFIELIRSGPLICWLYFAMYLLPDIVDPTFQDPEDFDNIVRMMLIFALFGGCYIAEVLRGGLQSVDSGQKEAATALGLNPIQSKLLIELPNAIRTTLPSIVSVFIGLWKDTTLLFIINILDFFKLAKDTPNTDLRFLGDFIQPVYLSALVFWIIAFYLSRISVRIEKNMGLVNEGGGEIT